MRNLLKAHLTEAGAFMETDVNAPSFVSVGQVAIYISGRFIIK